MSRLDVQTELQKSALCQEKQTKVKTAKDSGFEDEYVLMEELIDNEESEV